MAPLGDLAPERGRSLSIDLAWRHSGLEMTATFFRSRIAHPLVLRTPADVDVRPLTIVNAAGPTRTIGSEMIARFHRGPMDLIATHMYIWGTESDPDSGMRRQTPSNPRHTAGVDWLWAVEGRGRIGLEFFYTGRQQLDDSPYRQESQPYLLWGAVGDWQMGRARLFANVENLSDVRQTKYDPLVRRARSADGRWTTDVWAPLDGRVFNAGVRFRF